ncbi:acyl carrier protein [Streptomyces beigongshangae]|uniref:acyl carrier protein n=1 Tax=Streptomyces beigongshangae TaxID=2841597 RepID=UPI0027DEADBD|nr:acyl carrier protein [Streptomyces sp. REN17]
MDDRHPDSIADPVTDTDTVANPVTDPVPPPSDSVLDALRSFLASALPGTALGIHDDYFEQGNANSLFALELVTFVEREFSVVVEVEDLDLDNFRTLARTAGFVRAKRAVPPSGPGRADGPADVSADSSTHDSTHG